MNRVVPIWWRDPPPSRRSQDVAERDAAAGGKEGRCAASRPGPGRPANTQD